MNKCSHIHIPDWCCDHRLDDVADLFKCLADPTRLKLLTAMVTAERTVGELATAAGATPSAVSHQLRLLRAMRLVRVRREGRHMHYSLADQHVSDLLEVAITHTGEPPEPHTAWHVTEIAE
ncbi:MAG TPA: metalloregulator ArsR/SmtB family transcription factor [Candidatus Ozemobacteraceae bacterium]